MNTIIRRVLAFILSFALIFATTVCANANTSIGGWTALDTITAGATNTINATKTAGGKVLNSAITIAPQAGKVGKHLIKGGGSAALAFAMVELADGAIDWVLDPANNSVKWKVNTGGADDAGTPDPKVWYLNPARADGYQKHTASSACKLMGDYHKEGTWKSYTFTFNARTDACNFDVVYKKESIPNGTFTKVLDRHPDKWLPSDTAANEQEKSIPIDTVAAKVISNAEAGHAPSQEAVKAAALEGFAAGEHDAALDAAATETGTENPPDTENPPKDPDAPAEPFDPAGIISAINALKALLAGILSSITSLSDWFQSDPPPEPKPEDTELDIPVPDLPMPDTDINFGGSCPANFEFNGSIFGNPINIVLLDTSKFCGFLSTFVKFPVYAASSLFALYILGGRKDV